MELNYLLDTHALVWLLDRRGPRPDVPITERAAEAGGQLWVSAISAFETSTKVRLGKFPAAHGLLDHWAGHIRRLGARELSVSSADGILAGTLDWGHRDPWDRLLAAQAINQEMRLVTADPAFASLPQLEVEPW